MRLRTTLIGLLVVTAVVLSGTIYVGFALHKDDIVTQERQQVDTVANVAATDVESQLANRRDMVGLWAYNDRLSAHGSAQQQRALATFVESTEFRGGSVIDASGKMVFLRSENLSPQEEERFRDRNFSDRPYVRAALNGSTYIGNPLDAETGNQIVAVSAPIYENGSIAGVLTGSLHLPTASLFTNTEQFGESAHLDVVTAGNRTIFEGSPDRSSDPLVANATIAETGWTVTAYGQRGGLTTRLQQATLLQFGGVVLALVSIAVIGVWVFRSTIAQLDTLIGGLDALERGEYTRELDLSGGVEWRTIGDRYDALGNTLQQRDSQLEVLNRVLRHNLRNDMNVITAHAESALAAEETPPGVAENLSQIHATARRLIDTSEHARVLYEDLLTDSERDPEPVDVVDIVRHRVETLRAEFPECTIQTDLPDSTWVLDTAVLPIVVEEVIHNAIVHNNRPESERRVEITAESVGKSDLGPVGEVRIRVSDNGPGIPMVEEALLTDELEATSVEHGSGLGVWLVNWLVAQLGGTVEAHSGIDSGTTVSVRIPAAPADARE